MKEKKYWFVFGLLALTYLLLTFLVPSAGSTLTKYHISQYHAHLLSLSIAVPLIVIWFVAFYGFISLKRYTDTLGEHTDGKAFKWLTEGLFVLAISMLITSIMSMAFNYWTRSNEHLAAATIITNYTAILLYLIAFLCLRKGASLLLGNTTQHAQLSESRVFGLLYVPLSFVFCYFTLKSPDRMVATANVPRALYYLPDWLIVTTILLPYLIIWLLGAQTIYYIYLYRKHVSGIIYRKSFALLALGIAWVVGMSLGLRYLALLGPTLNRLSLRPLLALLYLIVLLIAVGYLLIAKGIHELKKIEEA